MYKASVVGIDNTGKTSVARTLNGIDGIEAIHLSDFHYHSSGIARISGKIVNSLAHFGEDNSLKYVTASAYFMHLFPYFYEQELKKSRPLLLSDRDPIVDTICYSDFYLPHGYSRIVRPPLKFLLEHIFDYPNMFFHLEASPEISASRYKEQNQMHVRIDVLHKLKDLFDEELFRLEKEGINVIRIDTEISPVEEVAEQVKYYLMQKYNTRQ